MDKVKINLDKQTFNKLNQDMILFHYYKNNKINKNGFINILIKNYFPIYEKLASIYIERYSTIVNQYVYDKKIANQIINSLISTNEIFSFNKNANLDASISFKPSNFNKTIFDIITSKYIKSQSLSSFLRNMIEKYLTLPQYKREQIIYLDNYNLLNESINENRKIIISIKNKQQEVIPYKIVPNKEEMYNYLICLTKSKNKNTPISIHLCKINYVYLLPQKATISNYDKNYLDKIIKSAPQFVYLNDENTIIKLTENGIKLFNNKYLNRPIPYKIENDIYYFDCSYTQLTLYFFPFGKDALILAPTKIRESFKKEYLKAYEHYD